MSCGSLAVIVWTACEEVHRVPDEDVIKEEESAAEAETFESSTELAAVLAEHVNDSADIAASSSAASQQDCTGVYRMWSCQQ